MDDHPTITPLRFIPAREVLARENTGFTTWLAAHLDYLEPVLGLTAIEFEERESPVGSFFLDIRASGTDPEGQGVAVPVENQYGRTDHDHLGKLITYTAQAAASAERVLGVWIVEQARDEHLAAVNFLNEISPARVGWVLAEVRFVPAPDRSYYVQFEPKARPNAVLAGAPRQSANPANQQAKKTYLSAVLDRAGPDLRAAGFGAIHPYGHSRRIDLPADLPLANRCQAHVMASQSYIRLTLVVLAPSGNREESWEVLELLRRRYERSLATRLPPGTDVSWHARTSTDVIDMAAMTLENGGYMSDSADSAGTWLVACCRAWLQVFEADPIDEDELASAADRATTAEQPPIEHEVQPS